MSHHFVRPAFTDSCNGWLSSAHLWRTISDVLGTCLEGGRKGRRTELETSKEDRSYLVLWALGKRELIISDLGLPYHVSKLHFIMHVVSRSMFKFTRI